MCTTNCAVRCLDLRKGKDIAYVDEKTPDELKLLIAALPSGRLIEYRSNLVLDSLTFKLLLQHHPKLQKLRTSMTFQDPPHGFELSQANWLVARLTELRCLDVDCDAAATSSYANFQFLIDNAPKLHQLSLFSTRQLRDVGITLPAQDVQSHHSKLTVNGLREPSGSFLEPH